jgi:hypothetical protein
MCVIQFVELIEFIELIKLTGLIEFIEYMELTELIMLTEMTGTSTAGLGSVLFLPSFNLLIFFPSDLLNFLCP